jgi:hypothetical protein
VIYIYTYTYGYKLRLPYSTEAKGKRRTQSDESGVYDQEVGGGHERGERPGAEDRE